MKKDKGLYELIYEYYESRILFGYYKYGDSLSSVSVICSTFQVGRNTVRAALAKLEEKGYIVTEERRAAEVVYRGTSEEFEKNAADYFVPRRDGIRDIARAGKILFLPLWEAGLRRLDRKAAEEENSRHNAVVSGAIPIPVKLCIDTLRVFDNALMLNLYWQCLRYVNFLYPQNRSNPRNCAEEILAEQTAGSQDSQSGYRYVNAEEEVLDFIERAREKYHLENIGQIPFHWDIYRQRPQVRYTLASVIIREIFSGRYSMGSYLPSQPKMAELYHVSLSTVRRTLVLLESLGVTKSHMGIGTEVCLGNTDFNWNAAEIRESLRLHGESLQILALTVRGILLFTLESSPQQRGEEFLRELGKVRGTKSSILCMDVLLSFIIRECPSPMIRECCRKLRELITWGYILSAVMMKSGQLPPSPEAVLELSEKYLRAGRLYDFADAWQIFIESRMEFFNAHFGIPACHKLR